MELKCPEWCSVGIITRTPPGVIMKEHLKPILYVIVGVLLAGIVAKRLPAALGGSAA